MRNSFLVRDAYQLYLQTMFTNLSACIQVDLSRLRQSFTQLWIMLSGTMMLSF